MSRQDEERVVFEQLILSDFKTWVVTAIHACNSYHIKISNNSDVKSGLVLCLSLVFALIE